MSKNNKRYIAEDDLPAAGRERLAKAATQQMLNKIKDITGDKAASAKPAAASAKPAAKYTKRKPKRVFKDIDEWAEDHKNNVPMARVIRIRKGEDAGVYRHISGTKYEPIQTSGSGKQKKYGSTGWRPRGSRAKRKEQYQQFYKDLKDAGLLGMLYRGGKVKPGEAEKLEEARSDGMDQKWGRLHRRAYKALLDKVKSDGHKSIESWRKASANSKVKPQPPIPPKKEQADGKRLSLMSDQERAKALKNRRKLGLGPAGSKEDLLIIGPKKYNYYYGLTLPEAAEFYNKSISQQMSDTIAGMFGAKATTAGPGKPKPETKSEKEQELEKKLAAQGKELEELKATLKARKEGVASKEDVKQAKQKAKKAQVSPVKPRVAPKRVIAQVKRDYRTQGRDARTVQVQRDALEFYEAAKGYSSPEDYKTMKRIIDKHLVNYKGTNPEFFFNMYSSVLAYKKDTERVNLFFELIDHGFTEEAALLDRYRSRPTEGEELLNIPVNESLDYLVKIVNN